MTSADKNLLAEAERHVESANRCLSRQLKAMSRLKSTACIGVAEELFATMLTTHSLLVQDTERIERDLGMAPPRAKPKERSIDLEPTADLSRYRLSTDPRQQTATSPS